jgi:hypothetical protein
MAEENRPNTQGFAGEGTGPEPGGPTDDEVAEGEAIAVPAGDLTGALTGSIDEIVERDADDGHEGDGNRR